MLRRPPTQISLTRDDIKAYTTSRRARAHGASVESQRWQHPHPSLSRTYADTAGNPSQTTQPDTDIGASDIGEDEEMERDLDASIPSAHGNLDGDDEEEEDLTPTGEEEDVDMDAPEDADEQQGGTRTIEIDEEDDEEDEDEDTFLGRGGGASSGPSNAAGTAAAGGAGTRLAASGAAPPRPPLPEWRRRREQARDERIRGFLTQDRERPRGDGKGMGALLPGRSGPR